MSNLIGQTVFARWKDGYYYPAIVDDIMVNVVKVTFLEDGITGTAVREHVVDLQEAFQKMQMQGNWGNEGLYYKGRLNEEAMEMYYNDGDVERLELKQLRGARPGETVVWKQVAGWVATGAVAGLAIYGIHRKITKKRS